MNHVFTPLLAAEVSVVAVGLNTDPSLLVQIAPIENVPVPLDIKGTTPKVTLSVPLAGTITGNPELIAGAPTAAAAGSLVGALVKRMVGRMPVTVTSDPPELLTVTVARTCWLILQVAELSAIVADIAMFYPP